MSAGRGTSGAQAQAALRSLLAEALELEAALRAGAGVRNGDQRDRSRLTFEAERLKRSVIRPLRGAVERVPGEVKNGRVEAREQDADARGYVERWWDLARAATELRLKP